MSITDGKVIVATLSDYDMEVGRDSWICGVFTCSLTDLIPRAPTIWESQSKTIPFPVDEITETENYIEWANGYQGLRLRFTTIHIDNVLLPPLEKEVL